MDAQDARAVARVVKTADGGCSGCVEDLAEQLALKFPEHNWRKLCGLAPKMSSQPIKAYKRKGSGGVSADSFGAVFQEYISKVANVLEQPSACRSLNLQ